MPNNLPDNNFMIISKEQYGDFISSGEVADCNQILHIDITHSTFN